MKKPAARVLAVEDHPALGNVIRAVLNHSLIDATILTTGEEALKRLTTEAYDLILLDINLPGISGIEVCRRLKANPKLRHLPVIFVSGETAVAYKEEAKRLGALDYIAKPFEMLDFLTRIMGHLNLSLNGQRDPRAGRPLPMT